MKKLLKLENTKNFLFVYWHLTDFCNFKCSYCSPVHNEGYFSIKNTSFTPTNDTIKNFLKQLTTATKDKELYLSLSGGEPTLHPMIREIINECYDKSNVEIITNGSRSLNWWKSLENLPHLIRISLHPEFTDIEKINTLASYILETKSILRFNLSMDPENWDQSIRLYNHLDPSLRKFVRPKTLHELSVKQKPLKKYEPYQLDWIKQTFTHTVDNGQDTDILQYTKAEYDNGETGKLDFVHTAIHDHMYYNWRCSAGSSSISINTIGQIHAGLCKQKQIGT